MEFCIEATDTSSRGRTGRLRFDSGEVETPAFVPVGTRATVRGLTPLQLRECGAHMLLANAYHLALSPGVEVVAQSGGLHRFMAWEGPLLTDSGGYQVFSLAGLNRINDEGVEFQSPLDGSVMFMGPREAMRIQNVLGADVAMAFDQCPPYPCSRQTAGEAVQRTLKWAEICKESHRAQAQAVFGIVQGSVFEDLRQFCAQELARMDFDGYAIGGVSVGEPEELRRSTTAFTAALLPERKPRYLMGVGFPVDILNAVAEGVDLFDCVAPTRMGRNATAFTRRGRMRVRNSSFRKDIRPLEEGCDCLCCRLYCRAYLNHLFRCDEMLGPVLLSIHNLAFYHRLMAEVREAIREGRFDRFRLEFVSRYLAGREDAS